MRKLEYDLLGAFAVSDEPTDTIRAYLSRDRTVVAIQYLSALAVGGTQFLCRLEGDALVVASNAFVLEFKKAGYFAEFLQNVEPAALHAAVLTRRVKLAEKHGRPVTLAADLESAARLWEEQRTRLATRR